MVFRKVLLGIFVARKNSRFSSLFAAEDVSRFRVENSTLMSSFADEHNTLVKLTRRNVKLNNLDVEPHGYRIYCVNINLRHQYGISVAESQTFLRAKLPQR